MSEPRKFWMRWRVRTGYPVAVLFLLLANPTSRSIAIGGIVAAFGLIVRGAASGHLRKDRELATSGPYACSRNPLYLGSAFLAAGFVIAGCSWRGGVLVVAYFSIFYYAVIRNEEEDLRNRFGAEYGEYASRVPLFFPWCRTNPEEWSKPVANAFSWAQYRRNREYQALIGTLAGLALVWLRIWLRARFGY